MAQTLQQLNRMYLWTNSWSWTVQRYTPTSTTLLYLPLNTTYTSTDQSSSHKTVTNSWVVFNDDSWVDCAYFNWDAYLNLPNIASWQNVTVAFWLKNLTSKTSYLRTIAYNGADYQVYTSGAYYNYSISYPCKPAANSINSGGKYGINDDWWHHFVRTKSWKSVYWYFDWQLVVTKENEDYWGSLKSSTYHIWWNHGWTNYTYVWYLSEFIVDNKTWSQSDVTTQYNNMRLYFNKPKEITQVYIYKAWNTDFKKIKWPCDVWFHIPTQTEWYNVVQAWISMWAWTASGWDNLCSRLKLPRSGYLFYSNWTKWGSWNYGRYRTSTYSGSTNSYIFQVESSYITASAGNSQAYWHQIRAFCNESIIPTSSAWTAIYTWSNWAWIYWNKSRCLITLSWDWNTRYTMQDRNLWCSSVYNYWDTLSAGNCWWFYQRGNNYAFPFAWASTTASWQVDVSTYWPNRYYNNSTFRTWNATWMNPINSDIRGWVSCQTSKPKGICIRAVPPF